MGPQMTRKTTFIRCERLLDPSRCSASPVKLIASSRTISAAIYPLLVLTQSVPKVALAPILLVALGANEFSRVIITFLVAFFPLVVSSVAGLLATPPELIELGRSCRAGRTQEVLRIRHPYALQFVVGGLRVGGASC